MGLETVEIVLEVEDEFKMAISDAEASDVQTVGGLVDLVYSRLRQQPNEPCPSQHGFYVVRRALIDRLHIERGRIKPDTRLDELINREDRKSNLQDLFDSISNTGCRSPALVRPRWMLRSITGISLTVGLLPLILLPLSSAFPISIFLIFGTAFLLFYFTEHWSTEFPRGFSEVKDLIKIVKTLDSRVWSRQEVFEKIRYIVATILGMDESKIALESHFIKDLNAG